jgi:hypothetical protein
MVEGMSSTTIPVRLRVGVAVVCVASTLHPASHLERRAGGPSSPLDPLASVSSVQVSEE